jgi:hypothetical protein
MLTAVPSINCGDFATFGKTYTAVADSVKINGDIGKLSGATDIIKATQSGTYSIKSLDTSTGQCYDTAKMAQEAAMLLPCDNTLEAVSGEMGGLTMYPGVTCVVNTGPILISAGKVVVLDGEKQWDSVFIFKSTTTIGIGALATLILTNGAQAKNIFWVAKGAVTVAAGTGWSGILLSEGGITLGASAVLIGRVLSFGSLVTLAASVEVYLPETQSDECSFAHTCG